MEENEKKKIIVKAKTNTTISEIAKKQIEESKYPVVGAIFNNEYKNLDDELQEDGTLELININSKEGMKIYRRTLTYIMGGILEIISRSTCCCKLSINKCNVLQFREHESNRRNVI